VDNMETLLAEIGDKTFQGKQTNTPVQRHTWQRPSAPQ